MRLTIVNQFYAPDISPTAQLATSLAQHRANLGDEVTVVASGSNYASAGRAETSQPEKVRVIRVWSPRLGKSTVWRRCCEYAAFYALACARLASLRRQDVVITLTTPPFIGAAALLHKCLHRSTRVILWNMDCYPDVLEATGAIKPGGLFSRAMHLVNRILFRRLDHLVCLDRAMQRRLVSRYCASGHTMPTTVIPNWERAAQFPANLSIAFSPTVQSGAKPFVILYSGNMGHGHHFETVLDAAERLRDRTVVFLFNGGGAQAERIAAAAVERELSNVVLQPYAPREEYLGLLAKADCALITLKNEMLGVMSPSKLHAALAMGLPVVYVGPAESNVDVALARFGCGVRIRPGDVPGLVQAIGGLIDNPRRQTDLRDRARGAFLEAYCDEQTLPAFDHVIEGTTVRTSWVKPPLAPPSAIDQADRPGDVSSNSRKDAA